MNKRIENTMFKGRETAAAEPEAMRHFDFKVGDVVQIRERSKRAPGRIGTIISIRYKELENIGPTLIYTVRFSESEGMDFLNYQIDFLR